jgi:hypothetical protein
MPLWYADVEVAEATNYWIVSGRKRPEQPVELQQVRRSKHRDEDF